MQRGIIAAGAAMLLLPGLAACGQAAEEAVEQGIEQGTGGDVELGDGGASFSDEQGNELAVGGDVELPSSWPGAVPVPDGTLTVAAASADGGANGVWTTEGSLDEAFTTYTAQLAAAGFVEQMNADLGGGRTANYTGNGYGIVVIAAESDGTTSLNVSVVPEG